MLDNINLNLYRTFYIVAKSKTIVEAAEKMIISQSGVSKAIKQLEDTLGTRLIYRNNTGISLTKDGEELLKFVESSLNTLNAGQKLVMENQDMENGVVIIGAQSHITTFYLLQYIKTFRDKYPGVKVRVVSGSTHFLIEELLQHKLDFIIDNSPIETNVNNIEIESLTKFDTCFVAAKRLIGDNNNLENYKYIMPLERSSIRKNLEKVLKSNGVKLPTVLEVETTELIIEAVKKEIGIGYVVKEAVKKELENKELVELKTEYKLPELELNLIYIKNYLTKISKKFINDYIKGK